MSDSLLKGKPGFSSWREYPGLISYVECDDSGKLHFNKGKTNEELPMITNSFLQLGKMIGKAVGLSGFSEVLINLGDKEAFFAVQGNRHAGMEANKPKS